MKKRPQDFIQYYYTIYIYSIIQYSVVYECMTVLNNLFTGTELTLTGIRIVRIVGRVSKTH